MLETARTGASPDTARDVTPRSKPRTPPPRPSIPVGGVGPQSASDGFHWLRPVDAAPRVVDSSALGRRLDEMFAPDAARWRAAQLTALLIGVDLDAGPGSAAARWKVGTPVRSVDLASRAGLPTSDVEAALHALLQLGALRPADAADDPAPGIQGVEAVELRAGAALQVAQEYVSDGPAASVAWAAVTSRLAGTAAALLATRALADCIDRPGRPVVVPYSLLATATRYSEGMVKRGIAAAVAAEVVIVRASAGRAPTYAFTEWALGRGDAPNAARAPAHIRADVSVPDVLGATKAGPAADSATPHLGVLRATVAGVSIEVPSVTGGELSVETVIDGRPVTARLTIPPLRR